MSRPLGIGAGLLHYGAKVRRPLFIRPQSIIHFPSMAAPQHHVEVVAPSRLHFGMLSFGQVGVRQFGGVGAMIDAPLLKLSLSPAEQLSADGPQAERALEFARRASRFWQLPAEPGCRITVKEAPRSHVGLGSGTQLAMAVAAGLHAFLGRKRLPLADLAMAVGRGLRSAIGLHGFGLGGLLVESGKLPAEAVSPLVARVDLPPDWRFVLLCPAVEEGLSGPAEKAAFEQLPPVPPATTDRLAAEVLLHMLPAASVGDFDEFSDSLYRYGLLAGTCFEQRQGGPFTHPQLVERLRTRGLRGVGQSSWGPTVFGLVPDETSAQRVVEELRGEQGHPAFDLHIAAPANHGAQVQTLA
ncbi:MAG: hypothetical protein AB7O62_04580 [Pirellulales bacterium]